MQQEQLLAELAAEVQDLIAKVAALEKDNAVLSENQFIQLS